MKTKPNTLPELGGWRWKVRKEKEYSTHYDKSGRENIYTKGPMAAGKNGGQ